MPTVFGDCRAPAWKLMLKRYRDKLRKNLIIARVLEPEPKADHHFGRTNWPGTAYAEVNKTV